MNSWIKVLEGFRDGAFPGYYYGLTPRFILGVCQIPIGKRIESEIIAKLRMSQMFKEMMNYNKSGLIVKSNNCEIHNGPVMSFTKAEWTDTSIGTTFEIIWDRYGMEIIEGQYHINLEEKKIVEKIFLKESQQ